MSPAVAASTGVQNDLPGFRPGQTPETLESTHLESDRSEDTWVTTGFRAAVGYVFDDETADAAVLTARSATSASETWREEKTATYSESVAEYTPLSVNQAQGVVGAAVGIMATLMIAVVILGEIDGFTTDLSGEWQNTSQSVSTQSQQTFDFLNLVPFLIVALFVLSLMMSRL